ncbi:MAG: spermidine synthase, partial [Pseudomonadota bacterium]
MSTTTAQTDAPLQNKLISRLIAGRLPFTATILSSAALIFLVQPLFAKLATPLLGGTPSVWNVSLVCFQTALLAGYAYAHALARWVPLRRQVMIHAGVLVLAGLTLPIGLSTALGPPDATQPLLWLIGTFAVSIAPVFIAISATSPLLQHWYGHSGREDSDDPYFLYGASNLGSLIGLVAYPVVMEPLLGVNMQGWIWSGGYMIAASGLILCGLIVALRAASPKEQSAPHAPTEVVPQGTTRERLHWLVLAFLPSSLLVGTTSHIATDIASAPFLWSPPLILFIGSFIIAFSNHEAVATRIAGMILPFAAGFVLLTSFAIDWPIAIEILIALTALGAAALYCHGTLAASRPPKARLTEFYFIMATGGVLGGAFNAIIAPSIFDSVVEFPLVLVLTLMMLPMGKKLSLRKTSILIVLAMGAVLLGAT